MMKIKYTISGATDIQTSAVFKRILSLLDKPGYVILERTSKTIEFKDDIWRLGSRMQAYGKVDGGTFEISSDGKGVSVIFNYYVSLDIWILFLVFIAFFALTKEIRIFYLFSAVLIFFFIHFVDVKNTAKKMLKNILSVE